MATYVNYTDEGGGVAGYNEDGGGGDDTSSVTICASSSSTINSHCFNTHHAISPTNLASPSSSSLTEQHIENSSTILSAVNINGSTTNAQNYTINQSMVCKNGNDGIVVDNEDEVQLLGCGCVKNYSNRDNNTIAYAAKSGLALLLYPYQQQQQPEVRTKNLLFCRRFKDSGDSLRNFTSLPLFIYPTSPSTHATSADGVGVAQVAVKAAKEAVANMEKNEFNDLNRRSSNCANQKQTGKSISCGSDDGPILRKTMDYLPLEHSAGTHHPHLMASSNTVNVAVAPPSAVVAAYPHHHHLNLHHHHLLSHHLPYSNNYSGLHPTSTTTSANSHHHNHPHLNIHSEQAKSLQELQHEVGALLEFRDLVIETFPDLKQKMASISSAASTSSSTVACGNVMTNGQLSVSVSSSGATIPLTVGGTLASRREWEPGIRAKRRISQKDQPAALELTSSSSLTRSRSNSQSGKKEPKITSGGGVGSSSSGGSGGGTSAGENNNGSVVQDSGFSTETSSSKEGHSASSTNGALTTVITSNRLSCPESDDELLNLLDVIHRKSNRLREEVEHLQNYERQHLLTCLSVEHDQTDLATATEGVTGFSKSSTSSANTALTPKTFRDHVERLNKEDIKQLRKERDRLLDKLAEMEAETLTGRIKAVKMSEQVEELINVKRDLEDQLKLAMAQRLELNSRVQQLQQHQLTQTKTSNSQSDASSSSPRTFLSSSANTVLSTASSNSSKQNTFQPVVLEQETTDQQKYNHLTPFHQSIGSDTKRNSHFQQFTNENLGRLDGIVSTPGDCNIKCRVTDSKLFAAILLETNVIELRRHLLTITVKNQVLMQKLDQAWKNKGHLVKRLEKSKEDVEDLRFQLEEKNIELEGTKAQLRVLESRLHSITPSSGAGTNSYLHSQNDYETNRSSASTTLILSRRGGIGSGPNTDSSDIRSATPLSTTSSGKMPQPITQQISTPSMKAMTHIPMDDIQHHSSSTESAHEQDSLQRETIAKNHSQSKYRTTRDARQTIISTTSAASSVSHFEQQLQQQQMAAIRNQVQSLKKFSGVATTRPSKIPLPGSKAAAYFAGKPPSGRPYTLTRSPPSANCSNASSRSTLSKSTGNLLCSKSPNSLKRADSAQSIRKDNSSSLSTNTSRSSTSSSIPLSTTPYGSASKSYGDGSSSINNATSNNTFNSPSSRILQNSPLAKPKRESLSTKVRQMDSLMRAYQHQQQQQHHTQHNYSNASNVTDGATTTIVQSITSPESGATSIADNSAGSYLINSTPKTSTIAAQLTSSLRKDLQLGSSSFNHTTPFQRRTTASSTGQSNSNSYATNTQTTRRFSTASTAVGTKVNRPTSQDYEGQHGSNVSGSSIAVTGVTNSSSSAHSGAINNGGTASDSDSGKNFSYDKNCIINAKEMKSGLNQYFEEILLSSTTKNVQENAKHKLTNNSRNHKKVTLSQYFEKELLEETAADACVQDFVEKPGRNCDKIYGNEEEENDIYTSYASYMSSSDPASDNLLVTFDYGSQDSMNADNSVECHHIFFDNDNDLNKCLLKIPEEESNEDLLKGKHDEMCVRSPNIFKVHQMQHLAIHAKMNTCTSSSISLASSLVEYNTDTSGDYGSWAQADSEPEEDDNNVKSYRYEDLIKNETPPYDDDDGNNVVNVDDEKEVLFNFNLDEELPPRWFSKNDKFYYRSVDYLN